MAQKVWLTLFARSESGDVSVPFYYPAPYNVTASRELSKPSVLGGRQPAFVQRSNCQEHTLTGLRLDGFHEVSVLPYLSLLQAIEASNSICSLIFSGKRGAVAPLLLDNFSWQEQQYLALENEGTGEPTVALLDITFTSF